MSAREPDGLVARPQPLLVMRCDGFDVITLPGPGGTVHPVLRLFSPIGEAACALDESALHSLAAGVQTVLDIIAQTTPASLDVATDAEIRTLGRG